jgi:hypothetical protein
VISLGTMIPLTLDEERDLVGDLEREAELEGGFMVDSDRRCPRARCGREGLAGRCCDQEVMWTKLNDMTLVWNSVLLYRVGNRNFKTAVHNGTLISGC